MVTRGVRSSNSHAPAVCCYECRAGGCGLKAQPSLTALPGTPATLLHPGLPRPCGAHLQRGEALHHRLVRGAAELQRRVQLSCDLCQQQAVQLQLRLAHEALGAAARLGLLDARLKQGGRAGQGAGAGRVRPMRTQLEHREGSSAGTGSTGGCAPGRGAHPCRLCASARMHRGRGAVALPAAPPPSP